MAKFVIFSLIISAVCSVIIKADGSCSLKLSKQIPRNEPVYLLQKSKNRLELLDPDGEISDIGTDDKLILFCPGKRNTLINSNVDIADVPCTGRFHNQLHKMNCTKQVTGDLRMTTRPCRLNARKGIIYEAGFFVDDIFLKLYEMCYESATASALYTHHQLNGRAIKYAIKEQRRVDFKATGIPKLAMIEQNFRKQSQISHFRQLLGQNQPYFTNGTFLSRGHLAPDADFIFSSGQFATYFYANVCPQFQSINAGNWLSIESTTRRLAEQAATNINIYTGTYGQLALSSADGDLVPLYMSTTKQIEVPKYTWKIVHNPRTQAAIVFITLNNPFSSRRENEPLCPDVCEMAGVNYKNFNTAKKGFTICCTYEAFSQIVSTIDLKARNILTLS